MPWLRVGDDAATNPRVHRVLAWFRASTVDVPEVDVVVCELFGFVAMCATLAAGHITDYVIGYGTARGVAGARTERLLDLAVRAGYMTVVPVGEDAEPLWLIVDDEKFFHMRTQEELDWEAQRKADAANPMLTGAVKLRDGDACRYCGRLVKWSNRKGPDAATYDHRNPGQAGTIDTLVVACQPCNSSRGNDLAADERVPLRPAPDRPFYSQTTRNFLDKHGFTIPTDDSSDPATSRGPRTATRQPGGPRASTDAPAGAPVDDRSADSADQGYTESGFAGSGRVGTGRVPPGTTSDPQISADRSQRNSRRGRRGRPRKPSGQQPSTNREEPRA